jgi:hypothetical protein
MAIYEEIEAFRKIINDLINIEIDEDVPLKLLAPRALCANAIHMLKRGSYLTNGDIFLLNREFLSVLDEREISISRKARDYFSGKGILKKDRSGWITDKLRRGAWGHEKRQPPDAYQ